MLHLKRPRMFPVLDELVLQMMGVPVPTRADARTDAAQYVVAAIRREGRLQHQGAPAHPESHRDR